MSADIGGSIVMSAGVGGTLDSGKIKLFEIGVGESISQGTSVCVGVDVEINRDAVF